MHTKEWIMLLVTVLILMCIVASNQTEYYDEPQTDAEKRRQQEKDIAEAVKKSIASETETKCMTRASDKCKEIGDKLNAAPEKDKVMLYKKYQVCTGDEYNKCACEFKDDVMQACYTRMKDQKPGVVRGLGCYQTGMKEDDFKACIGDPVGYLCKNPNSQQCADVKALCPNPCDVFEDLTKPVLD